MLDILKKYYSPNLVGICLSLNGLISFFGEEEPSELTPTIS